MTTRAAVSMFLVAVIFIGLGVWAFGQHEANAQLKRDAKIYKAVCSVNNVFKAVSRNDERQRVLLVRRLGADAETMHKARAAVEIKDALMPILNCPQTFDNGGRAVPLTHAIAIEYMAIVKDGKIPLMSDTGGDIVGKRNPEQGELADF